MPTMTVRLDDETHERLKRRLDRSGETLSEFVRSAVITQLANMPEAERPHQAWERLFQDCVGSGETDRSMTYKTRIKEKLRVKHRR
jgi:predicted DNA-binding protein